MLNYYFETVSLFSEKNHLSPLIAQIDLFFKSIFLSLFFCIIVLLIKFHVTCKHITSKQMYQVLPAPILLSEMYSQESTLFMLPFIRTFFLKNVVIQVFITIHTLITCHHLPVCLVINSVISGAFLFLVMPHAELNEGETLCCFSICA